MNLSFPSITRLLAAGLVVFALVGCNSGAVLPTIGPVSPSPAAATPVGGAPTAAQDVCLAMSEPLLLAALGDSSSEPEYGDVAGSDGVYCYYTVAGDGDINVEAQVEALTEDEFNSLAEAIGATTSLPGVGSVAFSRENSVEGVPGATVAAWQDGQSVTIDLARDGDQTEMTAAATALAVKLLADL